MDRSRLRPVLVFLLLLSCRAEIADKKVDEDGNGNIPATSERIVVDLESLGEPGQELRKGESRWCRRRLAEGEYFHLEVEQLGTDVETAVLGPEGDSVLIEVDSPDGTEGIERLYFAAPRAGEYTLAFRALADKGPGSKFSVRVVEYGPADDVDRSRAAAARNLWQAEVLSEKRDLVGAADHFRQAAKQWGDIGMHEREAYTLLRLGRLHARNLSSVSSLRGVVEELHHARTLAREIGHLKLEAGILEQLARIRRHEGRFVEARELYEESLALWRELGDLERQATVLNDLGNHLARRLGNTHRGLESFHQALEIWRQLGRRRWEGFTRYNLGNVYVHRGELRKAYDQFILAGRLSDPEVESADYADALTRQADVARELLGPETALELYRDALDLWNASGDLAGKARALNGVGLVHMDTNRPQEGREALRTALELSHDHGGPLQQSTVLNNLCLVRERLNEHTAAVECYHRVLGNARASRFRRLEVQALFGLARLERLDGRLDRSLDWINQAIDQVEIIRTQASRPDLRSSFLARLGRYFEFQIDLLVELGERHPQERYQERAFEALERSRTRSLLELLGEVRSGNERDEARLELSRLDSLREEINAIHLKALTSGAGDTEGTATEDPPSLADLLESYRQQEARWRLENPRYSSLVLPRVLSIEEIQTEILDEETLLLAYALGEERSFVWAVSRETVLLRELVARREILWAARNITTQIREYRGGHFGKTSLELASANLSQLLLGPVAHLLDHRRLLVVAPGSLQVPPMSALPDPRDLDEGPTSAPPLVTTHQVLYAPSVSVLATLRDDVRTREVPQGRIAVIADPVFDPGDERLGPAGLSPALPGSTDTLGRLEYTRAEAEAILSIAGDDGVLEAVGFDARRELVESGSLADYRILHFATHGHLDIETPELSSLVLSRFDQEGRPIDGYLRLYELFHLRLGADLVVLSACQTALGRDIQGEGLWGLTRGFMYAGAKSLLVSLWDVDDEATAQLMEYFYQALFDGQETPAEALRSAQAKLRRQERWQAPFYWAGFVLQGDWK